MRLGSKSVELGVDSYRRRWSRVFPFVITLASCLALLDAGHGHGDAFGAVQDQEIVEFVAKTKENKIEQDPTRRRKPKVDTLTRRRDF